MPKVVKKESEIKQPVIEEISLNYYLEFQSGGIYQGTNILRSVCVKHRKWLEDTAEKESREIVNLIDGKVVNYGYGVTQDESMRDFITRNSNIVLDVIFESNLVKI